ncbi:MAG: hydroxysqualene dehydroxylase HpnE [Gammaproteobacteria bacterium]|uniref:hydroxysqualene dehydroxylase HpnE n=1 Tax=Rhodoferax sp. TaxID=50421 RepID=UPI0017B7F55B|nr:hydroxysqualene dehydroxylase HpnE [Rhodoferax sp.]MBU3898736.1 hydroxysqualene dehydroxylase HpnE [Gammaproteobacteria bacterium]MBA3057106.1 FAD-binding protein [Rhodoferax sp.]MBU3996574.1 hydroxysqualene dehydroxylase HpnE [Gammaproteobacteria bacterium]MBU4079438.1 hydroxysqualene dehydroxylase HpnE [Gammaproteobacteria bacterium]MBU4112857.1 hydroxysqualene dehydroxylase HpnE [Gammaproteobacteria bacterium]
MKLAIIGAGWAGLAAAVTATQAGHQVSIFEAAHAIGGRARAVKSTLPDGSPVTLDNGQHILIGAYTETLRLMRMVGVEPSTALLQLPMSLLFPDGRGVRFPNWPTPLDALAGIVRARGWSAGDKWSLLRLATGWQLAGFACDSDTSVTQLCQALSPRVMAELIEPLCVSALNTPAARASASVFLRVMQDALFGVQGGSRLLLPRLDLSHLFPDAAALWLAQRGAQLHLGARVDAVEPQGAQWRLHGGSLPSALFDAVIFSTSASESVRALANTSQAASDSIAKEIRCWTRACQSLQFEAIATVYAWGHGASLPEPMLTLRSSTSAPAQFVFDRGLLGGPRGLLAFVVSASSSERATLQTQVLQQAQQQLGLALQAVQTIVEKRATFACTPALARPALRIAPGLFACGDYVAGPYPATLEGAVRSGLAAVAAALA